MKNKMLKTIFKTILLTSFAGTAAIAGPNDMGGGGGKLDPRGEIVAKIKQIDERLKNPSVYQLYDTEPSRSSIGELLQIERAQLQKDLAIFDLKKKIENIENILKQNSFWLHNAMDAEGTPVSVLIANELDQAKAELKALVPEAR